MVLSFKNNSGLNLCITATLKPEAQKRQWGLHGPEQQGRGAQNLSEKQPARRHQLCKGFQNAGIFLITSPLNTDTTVGVSLGFFCCLFLSFTTYLWRDKLEYSAYLLF